MMYNIVERPTANRRRGTASGMEYDTILEQKLFETKFTGKAIEVPLGHFHCSPAKGRLWTRGYKVKHRVKPDRETVIAWVIEA